MPRYDDPDAPYGAWYGLKAAANAAGWSLAHVMPPRAPEFFEAYSAGNTREFASRDAVCDWLDAGAPAARPKQMEMQL